MTLVFMNLEQPNIDVPMTVEVDMREVSSVAAHHMVY